MNTSTSCLALVALVLLAGCSNVRAVKLSDGSLAHQVTCDKPDKCLATAKKVCGGRYYLIEHKARERINNYESGARAWTTTRVPITTTVALFQCPAAGHT